MTRQQVSKLLEELGTIRKSLETLARLASKWEQERKRK